MGEIDRLGKYQIHSILGQGAMGVVYQGFDPLIGRTVALKTIRKGVFAPKDLEPMLTRLRHEAQAAGRLTHPGIVTVYEYGDEGETAFIAMEYVQGRELAEILAQGERPNPATAVDIVNQLLDILAYFHTHGVVHRDIKPGNILILADGRIKVTDFGIAKIESSDLTQFGDVLGTPSYMSPEQYEGLPVDRRSDLFSTGVLLYHLLTGEKPFPGTTMATIMNRVLNSDPPRVSELNGQLPASFDQVVEKALAKKAEDRFQSAEEFSAALNQACLGCDLNSPVVAATLSCPRDYVAEATVAMTVAEPRVSPTATLAPEHAGRSVAAVVPHRRWPLLVAGLILLVLAAGWWGIRSFGHMAESSREAPPSLVASPAVIPAPVSSTAKTNVTVSRPAEPGPTVIVGRRRPIASTSDRQTVAANGGIPRTPAKVTKSNLPTLPPELNRPPTPEPAPSSPSVVPASAVTREQGSPALSPAEAMLPPPRQAIKSLPGLGRKLREDEW